jgi:hypothetical protein
VPTAYKRNLKGRRKKIDVCCDVCGTNLTHTVTVTPYRDENDRRILKRLQTLGWSLHLSSVKPRICPECNTN